MHDDIEHRVMLARALREAGVGYDLIAAILRADTQISTNSGDMESSRITEARKLMAATLRQRDISNFRG